MKIKKPTLKEKVQIYEQLFHKINMSRIIFDHEKLLKLLDNIDRWSYAHRQGNGELSEKAQQELVNSNFWTLLDINSNKENID